MTPASVVRPSSVNIFKHLLLLNYTGPIELIFHMETPKDGGTKVFSNGRRHMTKMAATPIYGKNP